MPALETRENLRHEFEVHGDPRFEGCRRITLARLQPAPHAHLPDAADGVGEDAGESGGRRPSPS